MDQTIVTSLSGSFKYRFVDPHHVPRTRGFLVIGCSEEYEARLSLLSLDPTERRLLVSVSEEYDGPIGTGCMPAPYIEQIALDIYLCECEEAGAEQQQTYTIRIISRQINIQHLTGLQSV